MTSNKRLTLKRAIDYWEPTTVANCLRHGSFPGGDWAWYHLFLDNVKILLIIAHAWNWVVNGRHLGNGLPQKGRTGQGLYKSLLWVRDNELTATINFLDAGQCWLEAVPVLKNVPRGKLTKTTSSVVFAFLTIMLCQHGSTMKCTVQGCGERWGTFLRGPTFMAQGKLKKKITWYNRILTFIPCQQVQTKMHFSGAGRVTRR